MKSKLLVLSTALMLVLAGCSGNNNQSFTPATSSDTSSAAQTVAVTGVSLNENSVTLELNETRTLTATVAPSDASNKAVTWSATGDGVVSVDDGVVTALKGGDAVVTATTVDGGFTATCNVHVNGVEPKPAGAVDLEYGYAEIMNTKGDNYCYFNNPQWWSPAGSAAVNEAYIYEGKVVYDYTVDPNTPDTAAEWGIQLLRENTSLVTNTNYKLTFNLKSNKAGVLIVNDKEVSIVVGNNNVEVKYKETELTGASSDLTSFRIQFPPKRFGSARVEITNVQWEEVLSAPVGVVCNDAGGGNYNVAFSAVPGATGYKAYYVNARTLEDVDSETVTNGGILTKLASLPTGRYRVFVSTLKDTQESERSDQYGLVIKGSPEAVVPAAGAKTNFGFGEEHNKVGQIALPDDKFAYWNDQGWSGSVVTVNEAYTEEGSVHASYTIVEGNCNWGFQLFYKNTSLTAGTSYTLSYKITSTQAGTVTANGQPLVLEAGVQKTASLTYAEVANNASLSIVIPTSMGSNSLVITDISWVAA